MRSLDRVTIEQHGNGFCWVRYDHQQEVIRSVVFPSRHLALRSASRSNTDTDWTFDPAVNLE